MVDQYKKALLLHQKGNLDGALDVYQDILKEEPNNADALHLLGVVYAQKGMHQAAIEFLDKAIDLNPSDGNYYKNYGNICLQLAKFDDAVINYKKSLSIVEVDPEIFFRIGFCLQKKNKIDEAIIYYNKAIHSGMSTPELFSNLGNAYLALEDYQSALLNLGKTLVLDEGFDYMKGLFLYTKLKVSDWSNYEKEINEISDGILRDEKISTCFSVVTLLDDPRLQKMAASLWAKDCCPENKSLGHIKKHTKKEKIRIGYYSCDFHNHATMWLMISMLEGHDRNKFEIYAFSYGGDSHDELRFRAIQGVDRFIDVTHKTDEEVAKISRSWDIDIAVDLKGFTAGGRLGIFCYRAAPIQVSFLGYPGTLGVSYMDYLIADRVLVPSEYHEFYSEKIVYMPASYQVNESWKELPEIKFDKKTLGLPENGFVYCCFNNNYKITPIMFESWIKILKYVPKSVLWVFQDNELAAQNLRREAEQRDLDPSRLIFAKKMNSSDHLSRHRHADLFLDTLPCNAHTTARDALWAGLPVLTQLGRSFSARVAASLLTAVGLPELVVESRQAYEEKAIELAMFPEKLDGLKIKLRNNLGSAPLFDTTKYISHIERAYELMYDRYIKGIPPDHIYPNG